jgi:hypothetical protein
VVERDLFLFDEEEEVEESEEAEALDPFSFFGFEMGVGDEEERTFVEASDSCKRASAKLRS